MSLEGMGPCLAVEGATSATVFEGYVERVLAPDLKGGQIIVVDNLNAHKGERVRELIEERGCELPYLPPYAPDFNPIEEASSKIKGLLRKAQVRTREALVEALGRAISAISAMDAGVSSNMAATVPPSIFYETRCMRVLQHRAKIGRASC